MAKIVITNEDDLYTAQGDLVTENYELNMVGYKNPNNFVRYDKSFMMLDSIIHGMNKNKQDKEDNNLATKAKTVVGAINETQNYTDGLAGLQGENSFPLSKATEGQVYKEPNSKKYYVCVKDYSGRLISVPNGNFEELTVYRNNKRLNELFSKFESKDVYDFPKAELKNNEKMEVFRIKKTCLVLLSYAFEQSQGEGGDDALFFEVGGIVKAKTTSKTNFGRRNPYLISGSVIFTGNAGDVVSVFSKNNAVKSIAGFGWTYTMFEI